MVASETSSDFQVEVTDKSEQADVVTPTVKQGEDERQQFTLPRFVTHSVESSSQDDARLKVRLARLHLDRDEREWEFQLHRELELKRLEAETALRCVSLSYKLVLRIAQLPLRLGHHPTFLLMRVKT